MNHAMGDRLETVLEIGGSVVFALALSAYVVAAFPLWALGWGAYRLGLVR